MEDKQIKWTPDTSGERSVKVIPARESEDDTQPSYGADGLCRTAAYCRVSTEQEEQESSYEAQINYYTDYIYSHEDWAMAGIYADEGISGTGTRKREAFNRMISDCMDGKIDLIVTKSISRFARNTVDCLKYIRQLKDLGIAIYFEKENINTLDAKGEVLITIMASLAQQESQSISDNVRLGIHYQFQQGKVRINHSWFLGYTKDKNGRLVIVPEEAVVIRRIFDDFLAGKSPRLIATELEKEGIKTGAGRKKWYESTVRSILSNEKYMGDALLQKTCTVDFLTRKRIKNRGEMTQYYVQGDHEAIISPEVFSLARGELERRKQQNTPESESFRKSRESARYALSGRMYCGCCGAPYRRRKSGGSDQHIIWHCEERLKKGTPCRGRNVPEEKARNAFLLALKRLPGQKKSLQKRQARLRDSLIPAYDRKLKPVDARISRLLSGISKISTLAESSPEDESVRKDLADQMLLLEEARETRKRLTLERAGLVRESADIGHLLEYCEAAGTSEPVWDEALAMRLLDKITVTEKGFKVQFKAGRPYSV